MSDQPPPPNLDQQIKLREFLRRDAERAHDKHHEYILATDKAAIEAGNLALRMALIINGGAAVSVLAFIGGLVGQGRLPFGSQLNEIAFSLIWFALGVAAATLAQGGAYFTNAFLTRSLVSKLLGWEHPWIAENNQSKRWERLGETGRWTSVALALMSLALFIVGMFTIWSAVTAIPTPAIVN